MNFLDFDPKMSSEVIELFTTVFTDSENETEGKLIGKLVSELIATTDKNDLSGFVTTLDTQIIGSIFFSRFILACDKTAFLLSPLAIATDYHRKGVGKQLIKFGLRHLKALGADFVFTYGDPDFYSKTGFEQISEDVVKAPLKLSYPEGWLAQSLNDSPIEVMAGSTQCVKALNDQKYW